MTTKMDVGVKFEAAAVAGRATVALQVKQPLIEIVLETSARTCAVLLFGLFTYSAIANWWADPTRITLLLLVVSGCLMVGFSLFARIPATRDWTLFALLSSVAGTFYFAAVQLGPGVKLVPETVGVGLQIVGLSWQIFAKASLRRSFGVLPANRGVVSSGVYRVMRHPMYFGYFVADIGFLLVNFGMQNIIVYLAQFALQAMRIVREERLLSDDAQYREYKERVRYRVVPGLF